MMRHVVFLLLVHIPIVCIANCGNVNAQEYKLSRLSQIAMEHHSNKSPTIYDYTEEYNKYCEPLHDNPIAFLEINCGVEGFFSRKMWDCYFTHPETQFFFLLPEDDSLKIPTWCNDYVFQNNKALLSSRAKFCYTNVFATIHLLKQELPLCDIIIDSGDISTQRQLFCLTHFFDQLKPGGIYIIENLYASYEPCEPLRDERIENDVLANINVAKNHSTRLQHKQDSLVTYIHTLIDNLNYGHATSPRNFTQEHSIPIFDVYGGQWPLLSNKHMPAFAHDINTIILYKNACIITKKQQYKKYTSYPINYCISESKVVKKIPEKTRDFALMIPKGMPGDKGNYLYTNETDYYKGYQEALYGITRCKVGWDCMRHYEILANGCIPYFVDLDKCHGNNLYFFPKDLVWQAMHLPGVSYNHIDHTIFDRAQYDILLHKLLDYTKKHLTARAMAHHVLTTINYSGKKPILYLFEYRWPEEYLRDSLLIGMKQLLGSQIIDFPRNNVIYTDCGYDLRSLYGNGFSYAKVIDDIPVDRSNITERIARKEFEFIIYIDIHQKLPLYEQVCKYYSQHEIVYICASERYGQAPNTHYCSYKNKFPWVFIREWAPDNLESE